MDYHQLVPCRLLPLAVASFVLTACFDSGMVLPPEPPDLGDDDDVAEPTPVDTGLCGFEDNDLAGFGHPGESSWFPPDGGKIAIVQEGWDFSGLDGERDIQFFGQRAVLMRSNDMGDPESVAVIPTNHFRPQNPSFVMEQLSEVDSSGIDLSVHILGEDETVLEERQLEVHTGGYVPALLDEHQPIEGYDYITVDSAMPGEFTRTSIDVSDYTGEVIQLEFRQHTLVELNGFFTLLDNLCDGEPIEETR